MIQRFKVVIAIFIFYQSSCYSNKKYIQYIDSKENHVSLFTEEKGQGVPIVFIHGNSFDHSVWIKQFSDSRLNRFRLISYDLRGHGKSVHFNSAAKYKDQYSLSLHAEDLGEILKQKKLDNAIVVGWSLGGNIILHYLGASKNPPFGKAVIFGAPPSFGLSMDNSYPGKHPDVSSGLFKDFLLSRKPDEKAMRSFIKYALQKDFSQKENLSEQEMEKWLKVLSKVDGYARAGIMDGIIPIVQDISDGKRDMSLEEYRSYNIVQAELLDRVENIKTPVHVIVSDNDFFSIEQMEYFLKLNPDYFSLSKVYHAGHAVFYNSSDLFYNELETFLNKN